MRVSLVFSNVANSPDFKKTSEEGATDLQDSRPAPVTVEMLTESRILTPPKRMGHPAINGRAPDAQSEISSIALTERSQMLKNFGRIVGGQSTKVNGVHAKSYLILVFICCQEVVDK